MSWLEGPFRAFLTLASESNFHNATTRYFLFVDTWFFFNTPCATLSRSRVYHKHKINSEFPPLWCVKVSTIFPHNSMTKTMSWFLAFWPKMCLWPLTCDVRMHGHCGYNNRAGEERQGEGDTASSKGDKDEARVRHRRVSWEWQKFVGRWLAGHAAPLEEARGGGDQHFMILND